MRAILLALACGCAVDQTEPSACRASVGRYYGAGCAYTIGATDERVAMPFDAMTSLCEAVTVARGRCADDVETWLACNDTATVPECGCGAEFTAVLWCL